jgi:hypothetical protein
VSCDEEQLTRAMRNDKGADGNLQVGSRESEVGDELDLSNLIGSPKQSNERSDAIGQTFT